MAPQQARRGHGAFADDWASGFSGELPGPGQPTAAQGLELGLVGRPGGGRLSPCLEK